MKNKVRVYIATSLDGFIAGENDDLSWLPQPESGDDEASPSSGSDPGGVGFDEFLEGIGALLMGRRTYDVVRGFDVPWPYGEKPVLVATKRPLDADPPKTVCAVEGSIVDVIREAKAAAGNKDVYLDGGVLIRQALEQDLVDEMIVSIVPVALGKGVPLFAGIRERLHLEISSHHTLSMGMVQFRIRPRRG